MKRLIVGGGCFWCTEAIFDKVKGVDEVKSGYSGGHIKNPAYREICQGTTGHAEVVEITYQPEAIGLRALLQIHMVTHDPTTLNRQGADRGTQYRSIIFYQNQDEKKIIEEVIAEMQEHYNDPIVTEVKELDTFYEAEPAHQEYYERNSDARYCQIVIEPKLRKFREHYQELLKES